LKIVANHITVCPFYVVFNNNSLVKIGQSITKQLVLFVMHYHFSPFKQC
jgi:hypothetical protein